MLATAPRTATGHDDDTKMMLCVSWYRVGVWNPLSEIASAMLATGSGMVTGHRICDGVFGDGVGDVGASIVGAGDVRDSSGDDVDVVARAFATVGADVGADVGVDVRAELR